MCEKLLNQEIQTSEETQTPESFGGRGMVFSQGGPGGPGGLRGTPGIQSQQVEAIDELNVHVTSNDLAMLAMIGAVIAILSAPSFDFSSKDAA